eukprot:CAMPEP_0184674696 /NCGR_PEP_ID=MMETSP0308-20130426/87383_1 /TAXON_ID=38269 /ORGANISM="Gloeochaete witrockiana, Strain SAG 46.84" /LENGTH=148 /DNA_ID=CAMNT_0027122333 /DNA_START=1098 /DNA_END=1544 /DNA_ORIENTATION=-
MPFVGLDIRSFTIENLKASSPKFQFSPMRRFTFVNCPNLQTVIIHVNGKTQKGANVEVYVEGCAKLEVLDTGLIDPKDVTVQGCPLVKKMEVVTFSEHDEDFDDQEYVAFRKYYESVLKKTERVESCRAVCGTRSPDDDIYGFDNDME